MLKVFTLKNGLKVATYCIPEMQSVFLSLAVKGGSIFDSEANSGVAHFMEHLLVQGIPTLPSVEAFSNFIESMAGSYNALTYRQSIKFTLSFPARHLTELLKISSQVFFEPLFPQQAVEKERQAILEEVREIQDNLAYKNGKFFAHIRYQKGHPMLQDSGGSLESVTKINREDLIKFWSDFFYPDNTYLVLVGGLAKDNINKLVRESFENYQSTKTFPGFPKFTNQHLSQRQVAIRFDPSLKTCYLDLSFPSICDDDGIKMAVNQSVIRNIIGGLRKSRLFSLLRHKQGLVYDVGCATVSFQHFGYVDIYCQVVAEKVEEVVDLIVREVVSICQFGPTDSELEFAKNYAVDRNLMEFDHPAAIAQWIESDLMWEDKIYLPESYVKMIKKVDAKAVNNLIKKYWNLRKVNLVVQGAMKNSKENIARLEKLISPLR